VKRDVLWAGVLCTLAGCATRADLLRQDQQVRGFLLDQRKQLQSVQRELEQLRSDIEERGLKSRGGGPSGDDRLTALEQRVQQLEGGGGGTATAPPIEPTPIPPSEIPPSTLPPPVASAPTPAPQRPAAPEDEWRREIAREQSAAGAMDVPERSEYLALLDGLARQDCVRSVPQLNTFAANHKDSQLADNALYWAGRCYALKARQEEAISKFYEVGTRYPKGDRAPAALWAQGNLFIAMGNSPDARIVLGKLIRDYPSSEEAARARQKIGELEN
jgi:TolA-binding protein